MRWRRTILITSYKSPINLTTTKIQAQQTKENWQERIGTIRQLQDEEDNITVTITSWNLTDNEMYVEVEYRIDPLEEVHTERFKTPKPTDSNTLLEKFLDELGYEISTMPYRVRPTDIQGRTSRRWRLVYQRYA